MDKIRYFVVVGTTGGVNRTIKTFTCQRPLSDIAREAKRRGDIRTTQDMVNFWDCQGRGSKRYRYFLLSPNVSLDNVVY